MTRESQREAEAPGRLVCCPLGGCGRAPQTTAPEQHCFSQLGGWKYKVKVLPDLVSGEGCLWLCPEVAHRGVLSVSSYKDSGPSDVI